MLKIVEFFYNLKIRNKFIISFLVLIVFCTVTITLTSYLNASKIITEKSASNMLDILEKISEDTDSTLESIEQISKIIISNASVQMINRINADNMSMDDLSVLKNIHSVNLSIIYSQNEVDSIYIYNKAGKILTGNPLDQTIVSYRHLVEYAAKGNGRFVFLSPYRSERLIPLVKEIKSILTFETIGYLQINIRESSIRNIYLYEMEKIKGNIFVVNNEGSIVSSFENRNMASNINQIVEENIQQDGYKLGYINGEKSVIVSYTSLFNKWKHISIIPVKEITKEIDKIAQVNLFVGILMSVLAIIAGIKISWGISKPIINVADSMRKFEKGDFEVHIEYQGKDEVGYLSRSFNKMVYEINRLVKEVYELKLLEKEQQIKALQAQINPHFLYNTFDTINYLAQKHNAKPVSDMVIALSMLMRTSIDKKNAIISVREELELADSYLNIQKVRFGERLKIYYDINEDILENKIPKLAIQPIVENAIIHGLEKKSGTCIIQINGLINQKNIEIEVIDNGIGMTKEQLNSIFTQDSCIDNDNHTRLGLECVNKRIRLIFGEDYGLKIKSEYGHGTQVSIILPR